MASRYSAEVLVVITADEWDSTPATSTLYAALYGGMYEDAENPSGPKVHYPGRIKSDVVLEKRIGTVFWDEESEIDFGYIDLAVEDQRSDLIDFAANVTIATVNIYRVNISDPGQPQLDLVATTRSSDIGFTDEHTIRLRLESVLQGSFDAPINQWYYDASYPQLEGKPYPIGWAFLSDPEQLFPTVFVDPVHLLYHITDLEISSYASDAYDRGIALPESGSVGFTAADYGFILNQNPDGKLTMGQVLLIDPEDTGNDFKGLFRYVRLAMTRAGIWSNANEAELTDLEYDTAKGEIYPQFFSQQVVSLQSFMDEVFNGTGSWYYVDELSEVHFGRLTSPDAATPAFAFTDANATGPIKVEDDKAPGLSTRVSYGENPGAYEHDELAGGVTPEDRAKMVNKEYVAETTEPVLSFYGKAASREPIKLAMSYAGSVDVPLTWSADSTVITADSTVATADGFAGATSTDSVQLAQAEVDRWWADLYPQRRRFYTFDVPLTDAQFEDAGMPQLGQFCSLQSDRFRLLDTPKNLFIRRLRFNFSANLLTIQGWG